VVVVIQVSPAMVGVHEVSVTGINGTLVPHQRHVGAVAQPKTKIKPAG
jgi:hypothetical protein